MDQLKPPTSEESARIMTERLNTVKKSWDAACRSLGLEIDQWKSEKVLQQAGEAFLQGDADRQAAAAEHIRIFIAYHLLKKALEANDLNLQSSDSCPGKGRDITAQNVERGKAKLRFFSGTMGESIMLSVTGLRLPWMQDGSDRTANMLLREALKELFPNAKGDDGRELTVSFDR